MNKDKLNGYLNQFSKHIQKKTSDGSWLLVTIDYVKKNIVDMCDPYICEVLKNIREYDDKIEFRTGQKKGTYEYRGCMQEVKAPEMHPTFKNLTREVVAAAETVLFESGVRTQHRIQITLNVLNAYNSTAIDRRFSVIDQISDLLIEPASIVKECLTLLSNVGLITAVQQVSSNTAEATKTEEPAIVEEVSFVEPTAPAEPVVEAFEELKASAVPEEAPEVDNTALIEALDNFGHMQADFMDYFVGLTSNIRNSGVNKEEYNMLLLNNTELRNNLDITNEKFNAQGEVLAKALVDNNSIHDINRELSDKLSDANRTIRACRDKVEAMIGNVQMNMEQLIAEITNSVANYTQLNNWDKTPQRNAQFQASIINAVTSTVNEILSFNKTNGHTGHEE